MKIYVVYTNQNEEYTPIIGVFTNKKLAEAIKEDEIKENQQCWCEEFELNKLS